jgi:uncharacterized protein YecE (DUF72 family)
MSLLFGTCSWNFDSWEGLVYTGTRRRAAEYLPEYTKKYRTAEIDSWFYRIPAREDAEEYRDRVVEPKDDLERIAEMIWGLSRTMQVTVNANNHYEGSAPLTIERLRRMLEGTGTET